MKISKARLKQIIKEELEVVSENIDADEYYYISGENIIELRETLNNLENLSNDPARAAQELSASIKFMRTLLSSPNIRGPAK